MTDPITLKRRFLEEKFDPTNLSFQKMHFLDNLRTFGNFDWWLLFSTNYHHKTRNLSTLLCRVERPVQKTCHCKSRALFVTKIAKISDQSDKRKFQSSLSLSALIRIIRRFRFFCASAYKRLNSLHMEFFTYIFVAPRHGETRQIGE